MGGDGKESYTRARQIACMPIPEPYTKMITIMIAIHSSFTPILMSLWAGSKILSLWWAFVWSFVPVFGLCCINLIAIEIERPFGDDANDLPLMSYQKKVNASLISLLAAKAQRRPELKAGAVLDLKTLHRNTFCKASFTKALAIPKKRFCSLSRAVRENETGPGLVSESSTSGWSLFDVANTEEIGNSSPQISGGSLFLTRSIADPNIANSWPMDMSTKSRSADQAQSAASHLDFQLDSSEHASILGQQATESGNIESTKDSNCKLIPNPAGSTNTSRYARSIPSFPSEASAFGDFGVQSANYESARRSPAQV